MSTELEKYYNKFCEEKRLTRRHGKVKERQFRQGCLETEGKMKCQRN